MTSILSNDNNNNTTENTSNNPFAALLSSLNNSIQIVNEAKNNNVGYEVDNNNNDEYKLVRSIVLSVADTMENTSTKFSVSMDCGMSNEMIMSLCNSTAKPAEQLTTSCVVAARCNCSKTLRKDIYDKITTALNAMLLLVNTASNGENDKLPMVTGQVWEACKALRKLPASNKACIKRVVLINYKNINDVCKEVKEIIQEHEENNNQGGGNDENNMAMLGGNEFEDDDFFYNTTMSTLEYQRCKSCIPIFKLIVDTYKSTVKTLNNLKCNNNQNPLLDNIAINGTKMFDMTNELAVVLYPPQVLTNMRLAMNELITVCTSYLENLIALMNLDLDNAENLEPNKRRVEELLEVSRTVVNRLLNESEEFKEGQ